MLGRQRKNVEMTKQPAGMINHSHSKSILQFAFKSFQIRLLIRNHKTSFICICIRIDSFEQEQNPISFYYNSSDKYMEDDDYNYDSYNQQEYAGDDYSQQQVPSSLEHGHFSQEHPMDEERPFEILPLVRLYAELNQILEEIQGLVCLDKGWCLILLKNFKWDKDYLREQFYNRNEKYLRAAGFVVGLSRPHEIDHCVIGTCEVCYSQQLPLYPNICGHKFCIECWICHLKRGIQEGSSFPQCMDSECRRPVLLETITSLLERYGQEGAVWLKKYEKKICELFITTNRNYQFCTGVDCANCIKVNMKLDTVACSCGKVFCFSCQSDDHYPCRCEEKQMWVQQVLKEEADAKWISQNAKICPWCKKAVERSMGCNFMACTCGKNFCYMCSQPWEPDHKDHFKCHIYKKRPDDLVTREREIMQRMNHCTERYVFNQAVANNYKEIDIFSKRKYLFKVLRIDLTESEFMENAYRFAIECCEKLKWIYAFTYFHVFTKGKEAFEFSLGQYERYKENLLKLLAADLKKFMTTVDQWDKGGALNDTMVVQQLREDFMALKKQIVNYYTSTKSFKEKFVEEVKHITENLQDVRDKAEMEEYKKQAANKQEEPLTKMETKESQKRRKNKKDVIVV